MKYMYEYIWASGWDFGIITLSSNEDSGESAQMGRLALAFAACIHKVWM